MIITTTDHHHSHHNTNTNDHFNPSALQSNHNQIRIGNAICAGTFDKTKCKASKSSTGGRTETYYFRVRSIISYFH